MKKVSKANDLPKIKVSTKARNITMSTGKKKKKPQSHLTEFLLCHIKLPAEVICLFVSQTGFKILNQAVAIVEREMDGGESGGQSSSFGFVSCNEFFSQGWLSSIPARDSPTIFLYWPLT